MGDRLIWIVMQGESNTLEAQGAIYRIPKKTDDLPLMTGIRVRKTHRGEISLPPGNYELRFDAQNDTGKFTLHVHLDRAPDTIADDEYDTTVAANGLQFFFTIEAPKQDEEAPK